MRFRLYPSVAQDVLLLEQCAHARYVWNLGLEQRLMWRRWQGPTPGFNEQAAQLTAARKSEPWLAGGSQTVQQQALRTSTRGGSGSSMAPTAAPRGVKPVSMRDCRSWDRRGCGSAATTAHDPVCWSPRSAGFGSDAAARWPTGGHRI